MKLEKYWTIGNYWLDISINVNNPIFDFWVCKDNHVCIGDKFPYWHFRLSLLKCKITINPSIF